MATLVTRSGKGSPLTHAEVDANFTNLNTDKLELSGGTMTGNLSFGNSVKATFGASADLQIYHDGTYSRIYDSSVNLVIGGEYVVLQKADGTDNYFRAAPNAEVKIYYDGSEKLATTSTGVDITGTLTSDGLTVEESISSVISPVTGTVGRFINNANSSDAAIVDIVGGNTSITSGEAISALYLSDANANGRGRVQYNHQNDNLELYSAAVPRLNIANNGDISFYEDTGTTAKFFWDASAESLGIGTSSPSRNLTLNSSGTTTLQITNDTVGTTTTDGFQIKQYTSGAVQLWGYENSYMAFATNNTERMRIDSSGNVGIGATTVDQKLHLEDSSTGSVFLKTENTAGALLVGNNSAGNSYVSAQTTGKPLLFETQNTERMRIDSSGNVGIGTSSPSRLVTISATSPLLSLVASSSSAGQILFGDSTSDTQGKIVYDNSNDSLSLHVNASERMRIDSSGNVGIGRTSSAYGAQLSVQGGIETHSNQLNIAAGTSGVTPFEFVNRIGGGFDFYVNNATNLAARIDSSGNVGIGTTAINGKLDIANSDQTNGVTLSLSNSYAGTGWASGDTIGTINFRTDDTSTSQPIRGQIKVFDDGSTNNTYSVYNAMSFSTGNINALYERMRIDSSGNTIIKAGKELRLNRPDDATYGAISHGASGTGIVYNDVNGDGHHWQFAGSEKMRIDSSGNLLVGKTSDSFSTQGQVFAAGGYTDLTRAGTVLNINRLTADGDIVKFYKDGTTVGSIGSRSGSQLYIEGEDGGIQLYQNGIRPNRNGALSDATQSIGTAGYRFTDLYLSGGVYLGGTGAANKLDDYEGGTFTPEVADAASGGNAAAGYANRYGYYRKIGSLCYLNMQLVNINTTGMTAGADLVIRGLPFTQQNVSGAVSCGTIRAEQITVHSSCYGLTPRITANTSSLVISENISGLNDDIITVSNLTSGSADIWISIVMQLA